MRQRIIGEMLPRLLCGKKFYSLWCKVDYIARMGMGGVGESVDSSGEANVIKLIPKKENESIIIFDVGANVGNYTKTVLNNISEGGGRSSLKY